MNKNFRSVWNHCKQAFVAAAENVTSRGRPGGGVQRTLVVAALLGGLLLQAGQALAAPPAPSVAPAAPAAGQLPTGGQVSAGQAGIAQSGASMVITQGSERAAINWQSFSVGKGAQVQFQQPGISSVTLNRVQGSDPSQIFGRITANGQVILTNPSGVYFSPSARVDVGGLIATTHGIGDADFMAGQARFERNGSTAGVVNEGALQAALGGYIALLAPEVRNHGAVIAQMGTVALASGEAIDLRFDSNNRLTSLRVEPGQLQALVDNRHAVQAPGGLVILSAQSMDRLLGGVVKNSGSVEASGLQVQDGGRIVLSGSSRVDQAGTLTATSGAQGGHGGQVSLQGEQIVLTDGSRIDASGAQGGGSVRVGGGWQGSADPLLAATAQPTPAATTVTMAAGAHIDASATRAGDGGRVVLWSDVHKAESVTTAKGRVTARGGATGGNGGQVETSGHALDVDGIGVDAGAGAGQAGAWLLDPYNYTVNGSAAASIGNALNSTSVTVTTSVSNASQGGSSNSADAGDIVLASNLNKTATAGTTTLTLQAARRLNMNGYGIGSAAGGPLNLVLWSNAGGAALGAGSGGVSSLSSISTNGGFVWAGGGSATTTKSGVTVPNGPAIGGNNANHNPIDWSGAINTAGGDVMVWSGTGIGSNALTTYTGAAINAGSGNVTLRARDFNWVSGGNPAITTTGSITIRPDVDGGAFARGINTDWFNLGGATPSGVQFGAAGNTADVNLNQALTVAGPISVYGGNIYPNASLVSTASGASLLLKATGNIVNSTPNLSLRTHNGNLTLWADADGNSSGWIGIREGVTFNSANGATTQSTGGGAITLAGGSTTDANGLPTGHAYAPGGTGAWGSNAPSGVQLGAYTAGTAPGYANDIKFHSGGGNVVIKGKAADGAPGVSWYGGHAGTQVVDAGAGTITLDGQGVGTGHGIELSYFGGASSPTLKSGSNAATAIAISGSTTSTGHAGYQGTVSANASGSGGISLSGSTSASGSGAVVASNLGLAAASGDISISGVGGTGLNIGGTWGKGSLASSSSNITLTANQVSLSATTLDTTGRLTVQPDGSSFTSALTWPLANLTLSGTLGGLTLGKTTNTADITIANALTVNGPVSAWGGTVTAQGISAAGDITLVATGQDVLLNGAITNTAGSASALNIQAARHIRLGSNASITATNAAMASQLWADTDRNGDGIVYLTSSGVSTHGGDLTFGKSGQTATIGGSSVLVGGDVFVQRSSAQSLATGGGTLNVYGETIVANTAGLSVDTAGGDVNFRGLLNSGNAYSFVDMTGSAGTGSWDSARTAARNGTAGGAAIGDSYMVNIGSRLENQIAGLTAGYKGAWIGAWRSDPNSWAWTWADGPEAGRVFFNQNGSGGSATAGAYANFGTGEPNGGLNSSRSSVETVGQFFGTAGQWNDLGVNTTFSSNQGSQYNVLGYVRETNLAGSPVTINAGTGRVSFADRIGSSKALAALSVTAAGTTLPSVVTTTGQQTYNSPVRLAADTTLNTTQSDIVFQSTVDSDSAASPRSLTLNVTPGTAYYWVDWTSADATHVHGTITIGSNVINVTYTNENGYAFAQTSGGTNYWTSSNAVSPYTSAMVANGPSSADIVALRYAGNQSLSFSQPVENLAFSVVSLNGNGYGFNQNFNVESYTGANGAGSGYYGSGTLSKSQVGSTYQLNGSGEPHGTVRFANAFSSLNWNSLSPEFWNGFTVGVTGTSSNAGTVRFNGAAGSTAALGAVAVNAGLQTAANIGGAASLAVSGRTALGGNVTTSGSQSYASAVTLDRDVVLTTTSNGAVSTTATVDGARRLTVQTHGTGDTSFGGAVGGSTALTGLSVYTDAFNAGAIAVAAAAGVTITNAGTSAVTGVVSGTGATLAKAGAGSLSLSGTNTYAGATTVSGGTLAISADAGLGTAPAAATAGHLVLDGGTLLATASTTLASNRGIQLGSGNGTLSAASGATLSYGGVIAGSGGLSKDGAGALSLSGASTYTNTTTLNAGTVNTSHAAALGNNSAVTLANASGASLNLLADLAIGSLAGGGTTGGNVALNARTLTAGANNGSTSFGGVLSGTGGSLAKAGSGELVLTANSSYTGATAINGGSLVLRHNAPTVATSGFNGTGRLTVEPVAASFTSALGFSAPVSGSLSGLTLGKAGNGADITVASATSVNGPIAIHGGTVTLNAGLTTSNAGTGDVAITAATGLAGNGGVALANGRTLTIHQAGNTTYGGVISGSNANLVKDGAGDLGLAGASTHGGSTTVNAGILSLAAADRLPDSTALTVNAGATFSLNGYNESVGSIAGNGLIVNGAVVRDGLVLWLDAGNTASYSGSGTTWYDLSGNGYHGTLVGAPVYNASTSLFSFTSNAQYVQLPALPAGFLGNTVTGVTMFTVANFGTANNWERVFDLGNTGAGGNNPNHNIVISREGTGSKLNWEIYTGTSFGAPSENKIGANAAITDSVKRSYTGTADGANLRIYRDGQLNTTTASTALPVAVARNNNYIGKSNWQQDDTFRGDIGTLMVYNRALSQAEITKNHQLLFNRATATLSVGGNNTSTSFGGTIENGVGTLNLVKLGSGTLTLAGANSYAGTTTVSAGTLRNGAANVVPDLSPVTVAAGATWNLNGYNESAGSVAGAGSIALGAGTLTTGGLGTSTSFSGAMSGSGGITKTGAGTWTLTGTSSHSGATTVAAGTLASGAADSLSDASAITVAAGATLSLAGNSDSIGSLAGAGSVALGSATLTTGGDDTSTTFSGIVSGSNGNLAKSGSGTFTLTGANSYTGTTSANAGTLAVGNGGASGTLGSGAVTSNATLAFNRSGSVSLSTLLPHAGGITGSGTVTATAATDLTVDRPVNVAGAVTLTATAGSLAINSAVASGGTATLAQAGTLTDGASGSIAAASLRLQGGNVTLDNAANAVGTLAASGVGSLTYSDSDTLTIGTAGGTSGVSASGTVSIATRSGDLTLAANVATSSTSASALVLNAGSSAAAGTASGGNLVASGSPSVSVGAGGTARLYTGSIAGTSLGGLAGPASGSGRFRYGSDEASSAYSTALATGLNAIFRERPAVTVGVDSQAITYGDGLPSLTGTLSGSLANGDSASYAIAGRVNASSGNIRAGSYTLSEATLAGLGYSTSATTGTLTVAQRPLTLTGLTASDKVYDRSTAASVSNLGSLSGRVGGDTATLNSAGASASFADANAGSNKTVTVSGLALAGADAGNYSLAPQTTTATITPKALTVSGITAADKVYDATTAATISTAGLALSGLVAGDAGAVTLTGASGSFDTKNVGNGKTVSLSYTTGGSALANYRITDQAQTTASVTPATLTLSGASGVSKTYDGNDSLPAGVAGYVSSGAGSLAGVLGSDTVGLSGRGAFASANVARDGGSNVIAQGLLRGSIALSGADAGNYTLAWTNGSATIQPAPLTVRADNDARFVLAADPVFSVSYSGFVNGETAAVLTSTPTVTRPNAATDVASGSYPGALQVAGAAAANYAITHVAGDFTIVPASQLLVRVANGSSTYGTAPAYTIASASYWDPTANGGAGGEVVLGGITANGGNSFTVDDGASGSAVITLAPVSPLMSTSGALRAGSWQLDLAGPVGGSSANFSSTVTVVGAHQVNQATLNAVVNTGAKTKVYDASAAMMGLALDAQAAGAQVGDTVTLGASGSFDDKNASIGAGKGYTVAGIVLDGADAGNYRLAGNSVSASDGQITPRPLRVSYSGVDRVYDAGTSASVTTQDDRLAGDSLGISRSASFADKHVARDGSGNLVAKAVTVSGVSLTGADAGNYTVAAGGSTTATISPAPLAISGIVGVDKTYDRTTSAVLDTSGVTRTGLLGSDTVTVTPTGSFADVHAGAGRSITLASSHGGADAGNYSITDQAATTASVLRRPVEVSAAGGISKLYDGNTAMSGVSIAVGAVNGVAASGVVGGDSLSVSGTGSFSSAAVSRDGNGTVLSNKSYTLSNLTLSGASAADYMIAGGATTLSGSDGRIDPRTLGLSGFAVADKVYDGGTAATITSAGSLSGLVSGDVVSTGNTGASFASANAGHGRTATLNGVSLAGADAGNYVFDGNPVTASANISRATLTISGSSAAGKTYDGSTSAAITVGTLVGLVGSETLLTTATGSLDSANAGSRTATAQYTLADGSGLAANYTLADTTHAVTVVPKALSISGSSAANKTYDGSSAAAITLGTLAGLVGSETLGTTATGTLDSANAGSRTATAHYALADGTGLAANYTLADTTHAVTVAPKALSISGGSAATKTYDGSTNAAITVGALVGLVGSETLLTTATGSL
ncbi:MAG TPA: YDG domain-containing protein, partial [Aquabacterium sp.]|nr:YDG domain-containing protein [Aquabacterium sp.]